MLPAVEMNVLVDSVIYVFHQFNLAFFIQQVYSIILYSHRYTKIYTIIKYSGVQTLTSWKVYIEHSYIYIQHTQGCTIETPQVRSKPDNHVVQHDLRWFQFTWLMSQICLITDLEY